MNLVFQVVQIYGTNFLTFSSSSELLGPLISCTILPYKAKIILGLVVFKDWSHLKVGQHWSHSRFGRILGLVALKDWSHVRMFGLAAFQDWSYSRIGRIIGLVVFKYWSHVRMFGLVAFSDWSHSRIGHMLGGLDWSHSKIGFIQELVTFQDVWIGRILRLGAF